MTDNTGDDLRAGFARVVEEFSGTDPHAESKAFWDEMRRQRRVWQPRVKGRPKGQYSVSRDQLLAAYRRLRAELDRRPKQHELGVRLSANPRQIRQWLTAYRLPWPPE